MIKEIKGKIKEKIAYEKESYRISGEELKKIKAERPDLFRKGGK